MAYRVNRVPFGCSATWMREVVTLAGRATAAAGKSAVAVAAWAASSAFSRVTLLVMVLISVSSVSRSVACSASSAPCACSSVMSSSKRTLLAWRAACSVASCSLTFMGVTLETPVAPGG